MYVFRLKGIPMLIRNTNFITEQFVVEDLNRGLLEQDIIRFYENQDYNVFTSKDYIKHIKEVEVNNILKTVKISKPVKALFDKYDNGYPDLLLVRGNYKKFVKIKLDGDSIRPNQVLFLEELSKLVPTSLVFFNNFEKSKRGEEIYKVSVFDKVDKKILNQIEFYNKIAGRKGLKPLWVVSKLYEKFGRKILGKSVVSVLSNTIGEGKDKIVWFAKELGKGPRKKYKG